MSDMRLRLATPTRSRARYATPGAINRVFIPRWLNFCPVLRGSGFILMSKMPDSRTLLAQYVWEGSESALRELVNRYIDLVYSTALRSMNGDTHLAEDVAQTVFLALARKAHLLRGEQMLGGWLHQHTRFVAAKLLRGENRRRARERKAVEMNELEDASQAQFSQVLPILDEAIGQLGIADRTAILLRFFEQQDLRSVGLALGTNEDAARKRVARALDKLHGLLSREGVVLSVAGLGAVLAGGVVTTAPAELAGSIAGTALAGAAACGTSLTLLKALTMTKFKFGILGALVVVGFSTIIVEQEQANHKLRAKLREGLDVSMRPAAPAVIKLENIPQFNWRHVESSDYRAYIKNLRAIGCPEQTVRDIVVADVNALFDGKEKIAQRTNHVQFWRPGSGPLTEVVKANLAELHSQFETERTAVLNQLLGEGANVGPRPFEMSAKELKMAMLDFIPQEQRDSVASAIIEVEAPFKDHFAPKLKISDWNDQDRADYGKYCQDRGQELLKLLGTPGKDEYDMRVSFLSGKMRFCLPGLDMSEDEFRQIFSFAKQYEMTLDPFFANTQDPPQLKAFMDAQSAVGQKAREVLGNDRVDGRSHSAFELAHGMR
jgi:RNA polymerase sigma factor (sigma-70 family)